jgi:hypothetical protein
MVVPAHNRVGGGAVFQPHFHMAGVGAPGRTLTGLNEAGYNETPLASAGSGAAT